MDASCGPSNALKGLRSHLDHDRSLHQDTSRPSASGPIAFREGDTATRSLASAHTAHFNNSTNHNHADRLRHITAPLPQSSWANDFTHQHVHQHIPQQQHQQARAHSGWGLDFLAFQQQQQQQQQQPQRTHVASGGVFPMGYMGGGVGPLMMDVRSGVRDVEDGAAYEAAFAEAERGLAETRLRDDERHADPLSQAEALPADAHIHMDMEERVSEGTREAIMRSLGVGNQEMAHEVGEREGVRKEQDDLARTAGELVHALRDETDDKFAASDFMRLMRSLRDGEVVVDGDKFVDRDAAEAVDHHGIPPHQWDTFADNSGNHGEAPSTVGNDADLGR
ncbi:hypothetical protein PYCC9005_002001 [Savitreella phatthalungensis]